MNKTWFVYKITAKYKKIYAKYKKTKREIKISRNNLNEIGEEF